jgi:hypothetical protein
LKSQKEREHEFECVCAELNLYIAMQIDRIAAEKAKVPRHQALIDELSLKRQRLFELLINLEVTDFRKIARLRAECKAYLETVHG